MGERRWTPPQVHAVAPPGAMHREGGQPAAPEDLPRKGPSAHADVRYQTLGIAEW